MKSFSILVSAAALPVLIHAQSSVSLLSENPTAIPLTAINSAEPTATTIGLGWTTTPAAGAVPTYLAGAPGLPDGKPHTLFSMHYVSHVPSSHETFAR